MAVAPWFPLSLEFRRWELKQLRVRGFSKDLLSNLGVCLKVEGRKIEGSIVFIVVVLLVAVTAQHTHPAIPQGFHKRVRAVRRRPLPFVEEAEDLLYGVWVWQAAEEKSER